MINKKSPIPLYYQLEEHIIELIEKGELRPDDALPPEREYAEKFEISRMTVRQAYTELVNKGYLYRLQGKGTYVAERKIEQPLQGLTSFTEEMKARGMEPGSQLIHFQINPASENIANQLAISESEPVYEIMRVRLADGVPMAIETTYIPANLIQGMTQEIVNQSLYAYIQEKLKLRISSGSQVIESSIASQTEAKLLHIGKGAPVMLIESTTYLENGTPIEYVKSVYRADRYKFILNINR
ncbi:GntR family transcriptional regulator [Bacillus sp. FJAT-29814]|uniref:GntR family transcriptional regulator n=1 Tax=Bacillus sp. FJAT-29814 TaxID=1729688 RepID=UPI00082D0776|nr:GntR family transcriptional regulator [Bacillus sp. FJAT-29814]